MDLGGWSTVSVVEKHYTGEVQEPLRAAMIRLDRLAQRDVLRTREENGQREVS